MNEDQKPDLTPALVRDASFGAKIADVDKALKDRSKALKDIKTAWANVVIALTKYDVTPPRKRPEVSDLPFLANNVKVYEPLDPRLDDKLAVEIAVDASYPLANLFINRPTVKTAVEDKFPGFTAWCDEIHQLAALAHKPRTVDEEATKAARSEVMEVVQTCVEAIEAYNETVEGVANVKEYIAVVKDVAEISAVAQSSYNQK